MPDDVMAMLAARRRAERLTQRDLAGILRIPQSTVSAIENGDRQPKLDLLHRYAEQVGAKITVVDAGAEA